MSVNLEEIKRDTLEIIRLKNINTGNKLSFEKMYSQIEEILKINGEVRKLINQKIEVC